MTELAVSYRANVWESVGRGQQQSRYKCVKVTVLVPERRKGFMSKTLDANLYISGEAQRARDTLVAVLQQEGFRIEWQEEWSGVAKKGNFTANVLLGAFAQYFELWFAFQTLPDGNLHLRLYRTGSGIAGGLIGWTRVRNKFNEVVQRIELTFSNAGVLLGAQGR